MGKEDINTPEPQQDSPPATAITAKQVTDKSTPAILPSDISNSEVNGNLPPKENRLIKFAPLVISILALAVSSLSFYFQNLNTKHELKIRHTQLIPQRDSSSDDKMTVTSVVVNEGNRSEVITFANLITLVRDSASILQGVINISNTVGLFVIKPNEPIAFSLETSYNSILQNIRKEMTLNKIVNRNYVYKCDIKLILEYLRPNGKFNIYTTKVFDFTYSDKSYTFNGFRQDPEKDEFIDLFKLRQL
jgi:hypothetical protein